MKSISNKKNKFLILISQVLLIGVLKPIILVPGLNGSVLEVKRSGSQPPHFWCKADTNWFVDWVNIHMLHPLTIKCLLQDFDLYFDPESGTFHNSAGISIRPKDFGGVGGIDFIDPHSHLQFVTEYFNTMIEYLQDLGQVANQNLHGAPQDWRLTGHEHSFNNPHDQSQIGGQYQDLKSLIETTYRINNEKVVIISHSLGCPTIHQFISKQVNSDWRRKQVDTFIPISGPWSGTSLQTQAQMFGSPFRMMPQNQVQPVQVRSPVGLWLLPGAAFDNESLIRTPTKSYTNQDYDEFLKALGHDQAYNLHRQYKDMQNLPEDVPIPKDIKQIIMYSFNNKTPREYEIDGELFDIKLTKLVETIYGDGDIIVNIESLSAFDVQASEVYKFDGINHWSMIKDLNVLNKIKEIIQK